MSTRWTPEAPRAQQPESSQPKWKKYLLPGAGAAALLLVVIVVVAIMAASDDEHDDDNDETDDIELALDAEASETRTPEAEATEEEDLTPTPEPTIEMTTPTPEPDDAAESELVMIPTPTPTPIPVAEEPVPTEPPAPAPDQPAPEAPPVTGDFGELPPADMPSGSAADSISLSFNLDMSLQSMPGQASVYQINRRQWTASDVQSMASRLGVNADVVDQGGGSFRAEGSSASVYVSPTTIQFVRSSSGDSAPSLPGNDQLVQTARSWLVDNGLTGTGVGSGQVLDRDESTGRAFVQLKPAEPSRIISGTPSAGVTVRGDGVITEATITWPQSLSGSTYGLRSADNLWADATQGRGFVDIRASDLPGNFQGASGTVSITSGGIAYTIAGSSQGSQYLVPVAVFSGTATVNGTGGIPVNIYVPAAAAQAGPRG